LRTLTKLILSVLLIISSTAYADGPPPLELKDEGTSQGRPVYTIDCVGSSVSCARSGTTGTITVSSSGGGGDNNVLTSDVSSVPYYNTRSTISEDRTFLWLPLSNTLTISQDIGQVGTQLALAISSESGVRVASISHDGSAYFNKVQLSNDLAVADGGTGLSSGTSGGILGYTGAGTLASSVLLNANGVLIGGGSGATPTSITADTVVTHALFATSGSPAFRQVLSTDILGVFPMGATVGHKVFIQFPVQSAKLSSDGSVRIDAGVGVGTTPYTPWRLLFASRDSSTAGNNVALWQGRMDDNWQGGELTARIDNIMLSSDSTTGVGKDIQYGVSIWAITSGDAASLTTESYGTENTKQQRAPSVQSRDETVVIPLADTDSLTAGDWYIVKLRRVGAFANSITGDSGVIGFSISET